MIDLWIKSQNKGVFARVSGVYIEKTKYFKENKSHFKPIELEKVRWKIVGIDQCRTVINILSYHSIISAFSVKKRHLLQR